MEKLKYFYLKNYFHLLDVKDFYTWLTQNIEKIPAEIYPFMNAKQALNLPKVFDYLMKYDYPHYEICTAENLALFKDLVQESSILLLNKQIKPLVFCNFIKQMEGLIDKLVEKDRTINYPTWLGDLYNTCDWCDENWTNENSEGLIEEVKNNLNNL